MKKLLSGFLIAAVIALSSAPVFADTASYTTLTAAQEGQLNEIGAPSAILAARGVQLGTLLKELIDPTFTLSPSADSAATNQVLDVNLSTPVDTTGTNTHEAVNVDLTIGNATGGTNTAVGFDLSNVTGDASVNVRGFRTGTGTTLGTSYAFEAGSGWDRGFYSASPNEAVLAPSADSAVTNAASTITYTTPVDTTGTNSHYALNIAGTIGNASGGTNVFRAINIANITGDSEVTENGLVIGTGFDNGLVVNSPVSITQDVVGDGGDQLYGFLANQVAATTTSLTAAQCGSTIVGDSADVITLPEASTVLGCRYTFVAGTSDDVDINPADGTDVIGTIASITGTNTTTVLAPSAGDAIRMTDAGASLTLEATGANAWNAVGVGTGIWTDVN